MIYLFRELVVHREGLSKSGFEYKGRDGNWRANFIKVSAEIKEKLKLCGDKARDYDPFTKWGFYDSGTQYFVDAYNFSLEAVKKLTEFIEKYLKLLGYSSFIELQEQKNNDFTKRMKFFKRYHLGF
jgi:hypothetical protein